MRISLRSYLSSHLLWTARHEAKLAEKIEAAHVARRTRFSIEHRARVLSSIVASVAFLEAMINELYQDAADGHASKGGHITPLSLECRQLMAELWQSTRSGMLEVIEKYERLLLLLLGAVWVASPIDLIPEFIPVLGPLDDVMMAALILRHLLRTAGRGVIAEHWKGDPATLERLLRLFEPRASSRNSEAG